jgi:hypothetical protein
MAQHNLKQQIQTWQNREKESFQAALQLCIG